MTAPAALAALTAFGPFTDAGLRFCVLAPAAAGGLDAYRVDIDGSARDDLAGIAETTRAALVDATMLAYAPAALVPPRHAMYVPAVEAALLTAVQATVDTGDVDAFDPGSDAAARVSMAAARFSTATGAVVTFYRVGETLLQLRRRVFGLVRRNGVYHRLVPADVLLMQPTFDVVVVDGVAFFGSKPKFERAFGFLDRLIETSAQTFDQVTAELRIDGLPALRAAATSNPQMMAKMASIKRSLDDDPQYAQAMCMDRLVPFVRSNPGLGITLSGPASAPEFVFDPSSRNRFKILNLLDDDYLRSVLTDREYEATSKTRRIT